MRKLSLPILGCLLALFAGASLGATASPNNTVVIAPSTALITDAAGNTWGINATAKCTATWATAGSVSEVTINGVLDPTTCQDVEIAYVNGVVWQENSKGQWYSKASATATAWSAMTMTSPLPGSTTKPATTPTQAVVSWTAVTTNTDGSAVTQPITYNLYQGLTGALAKIQSGLSVLTLTITAGLTVGTSQCFAVTAVEAGVESAQSPQACTAIQNPTPGSPSQVTVVINQG